LKLTTTITATNNTKAAITATATDTAASFFIVRKWMIRNVYFFINISDNYIHVIAEVSTAIGKQFSIFKKVSLYNV